MRRYADPPSLRGDCKQSEGSVLVGSFAGSGENRHPPPLTASGGWSSHEEAFRCRTPRRGAGLGNLSMYAVPPLRPAASSCPRISPHAGQPAFAGGEPLGVPEAMELLSGMKRQK